MVMNNMTKASEEIGQIFQKTSQSCALKNGDGYQSLLMDKSRLVPKAQGAEPVVADDMRRRSLLPKKAVPGNTITCELQNDMQNTKIVLENNAFPNSRKKKPLLLSRASEVKESQFSPEAQSIPTKTSARSFPMRKHGIGMFATIVNNEDAKVKPLTLMQIVVCRQLL